MTLYVTDTNVFIDLLTSRAISLFFGLPIEVCTTDFVLSEIKDPDQAAQLQPFVDSGRLTIMELDAKEVQEVGAMQTKYILKGITDKSVLLKAEKLQAPLLSGDGNLRKEAKLRDIEVHGTLWVVRQIWEHGLADRETLLQILTDLERNARLPAKELAELREEIATSQGKRSQNATE